MARRYDDEDYGEYTSGFEKFKKTAPKKKYKGHQSRRGNSAKWSIVDEEDDDLMYPNSFPIPTIIPSAPAGTPASSPKPVNAAPTPAPTYQHQFGPHTREIKGVKIDMDGVINIEKIDNTHNGVPTYGIKFYFSGNKGLYRIIWFNTNYRDREIAFGQEYSFWKNLKK